MIDKYSPVFFLSVFMVVIAGFIVLMAGNPLEVKEVKASNDFHGITRFENDEVICYRLYTSVGGLSCKWKEKP